MSDGTVIARAVYEYTKEVREQVVWAVLDQKHPIPEAARRLAMSEKTLAKLRESRRPITDLEVEMSRLKRDLAEARMECDILKKQPRTLPGAAAGYALFMTRRVQYPVGLLCRVLGVSRSGCLTEPLPLEARSGECAARSGDPSCPCAHMSDVRTSVGIPGSGIVRSLHLPSGGPVSSRRREAAIYGVHY